MSELDNESMVISEPYLYKKQYPGQQALMHYTGLPDVAL